MTLRSLLVHSAEAPSLKGGVTDLPAPLSHKSRPQYLGLPEWLQDKALLGTLSMVLQGSFPVSYQKGGRCSFQAAAASSETRRVLGTLLGLLGFSSSWGRAASGVLALQGAPQPNSPH